MWRRVQEWDIAKAEGEVNLDDEHDDNDHDDDGHDDQDDEDGHNDHEE